VKLPTQNLSKNIGVKMPFYRFCHYCGKKASEEMGEIHLYVEVPVEGFPVSEEYFAFHDLCYPLWVKEGCPI